MMTCGGNGCPQFAMHFVKWVMFQFGKKERNEKMSDKARNPEAMLCERHVPMSRQIAARLNRRYTWVGTDDLQSYAYLGLALAAKRYSPDHGVPFDKYAFQKGTYLAIDEMRKDGILRRRNAKPLPTKISISRYADGEHDSDIPVVDNDSDREHSRLEARDICVSLLKKLSEKDRQLLMMYYADELRFKEIAKVFGVSESAICLRHKALITKLRRLAGSAAISYQDFL